MCGIAGLLDGSRLGRDEEIERIAGLMAGRLSHRGPDDAGRWSDGESGIAFGHRRLSILDLSSAGHQPMLSVSGRWVLGFNGEVYNFRSLRRELRSAGHTFRGDSDTEVVVEAVDAWGVRPALERFVGMFAFSLWDRAEDRLHLVRDRLGIKPLYWARRDGGLFFASELKGLCAHPDFRAEIDREALALYFRHCYIPAPHTIYEGVRKLPGGHLLTAELRGGELHLRREEYWSARDVAERGVLRPFTGTDEEAADLLESTLREAVESRLVSDVPVGAFLSGGLDSSTVAALMQASSERPVRTFSIGFDLASHDESAEAERVARHLGTDHTEMRVSAGEAREVIPDLPAIYDEPFGDSSAIPTVLLSRLTRRHVKVSLSGDGGDELFGGYDRYRRGGILWGSVGWMPPSVRRGLGAVLRQWPVTRAPFSSGDGDAGGWRSGLSRTLDRIPKLGRILVAEGPDELYGRLHSHWKEPSSLVRGVAEPPEVNRPVELPEFLHRMMYRDQRLYLPDDILTKVDRASMAASLEARVPLLDHRVVELAWRLPTSMKVRGGEQKWILRRVLHRHVPRELVDRPKMGFGVPIGDWLRGPLRGWAEALLDERSLRADGLLEPEPVRTKWREHLSGARNWEYHLWDVLMFRAWRESR